MITWDQIYKLASRRNVRRIAAENFLSSLGDLSLQEALGNLEMDAKSYSWNGETRTAIHKGILTNFCGA